MTGASEACVWEIRTVSKGEIPRILGSLESEDYLQEAQWVRWDQPTELCDQGTFYERCQSVEMGRAVKSEVELT